MSESYELKKLIDNMGALLVLNTQVSMDGSVERKKNDILCRQGGVVKAINELKAKEEECERLREWVENERDDWGSTNKDRINPFMRTLSKIKELQKGGESE